MSLSLDEVREWCGEARAELKAARAGRFPRLAAISVRDSAVKMFRRVPEVAGPIPYWQPEPGSDLAALLGKWVLARAFRYYRAAEAFEIMLRDRGVNPHPCVPSNYGRADEVRHLAGPVLGPFQKIKDRSRHEASLLIHSVREEASALVLELRRVPQRKEAKPEREIVRGGSKLQAVGLDVLLTKHFLERLAYRRGNLNVGRFFHVLPKLVVIFRERSPKAVKVRIASNCYVVGRLRSERLTLITVMPVKGETEQERGFWHTLQNPSTELVDARGDLE